MVYRDGLENRRGCKPSGGSNPSLSANSNTLHVPSLEVHIKRFVTPVAVFVSFHFSHVGFKLPVNLNK